MKIKELLLATITVAALASCSSGTDPKTILPTSTEFTSGEIAKYIEVVNEPAELTFSERDGAFKKQYIQLKVKLKATDCYDEVDYDDYRDMSFTSLFSVAIINLVDEYGTKVQALSVKSEDMLKLKKLIAGYTDSDVETIVFEGEYHNHKDAPKWFKEASQFTPYLTGDISFPNKKTTSYSSSYSSSSFSSSDDSENVSSSSSSSNTDWDSVLDEYEKYVDKYIAMYKKAMSGDMSALASYAGLLESAEKLSEKLDDAEDDMTTSQMNRYMKITQKMTSAALDALDE